ncbi:MAG: hypothetical protein ACRDP6_48870 [Actinoallomurus sp.]
MTTDVKLDSKLTTSSGDALADHATSLYNRLGTSRIGIVELAAVERTTPAPAEDKAPGVKLRIVGLEVANADQENAVREAQRALYLQRTARGTLSEENELEVSKDTLRLAGRHLHAIETARLRAGLEYWNSRAQKVVNSSGLLEGEVRRELKLIADGLNQVLHPGRPVDEDDPGE